MTVNGIWVFVAGCGGGLLAEFAGIWALRKEDPKSWPAHYGQLVYWAISVGMILVGGFLAIIYGVHDMPVLLALNIGASAPLIIQRILTVAPTPIKSVADDARIS